MRPSSIGGGGDRGYEQDICSGNADGAVGGNKCPQILCTSTIMYIVYSRAILMVLQHSRRMVIGNLKLNPGLDHLELPSHYQI